MGVKYINKSMTVCPTCNGTGVLPLDIKDNRAEKVKQMIKLREMGRSYRQIAKDMNLSVTNVFYHLKKKK